MTDAEYVFQQDVKERKKMKTGAMHRKCGSKSKKCTLPSDYLTPSQKKKLNGECEIMNLNRPLNGLDELRKYSSTLQAEYLRNCIKYYGARKGDLVKMLKTNYATFDSYCKRNNIALVFPKTGHGWNSKMDERWDKFIKNGAKEFLDVNDVIASIKDSMVKPERKPEIEEIIPVSDNGTQLLDQKIIPSKAKPEIEADPVVLSASKPLDIQPTTSIRDTIQECVDAIIGTKAEEPKEEIIEEPKEEIKEEPISGYNAVRRMKIDLKGSKAEIMHLMEAILGQECNYIVKLDIINVDKKNSA